MAPASVLLWVLCALLWVGCQPAQGASSKKSASTSKVTKASADGRWQHLSAEQARVIVGCGTERPFTGRFVRHKATGTYTCARCGSPLFRSTTKFRSGSGWPSFDEAIAGAVREIKDKDGRRVEIQCRRCGGHLGHVFRGERMTKKNTRHCVNSVSLAFSKAQRVSEAFFAGGCFWGVEYLLESIPGVVDATSGYMGGHIANPTYAQVSSGRSGHAETVRVRFDAAVVSYEALAKRFFEIHDRTQRNRQGPDRGPQYRSAIYVTNPDQKAAVNRLSARLQARGLSVATTIHRAGQFWPAERYHQDYYKRKGTQPYCHRYTPGFGVTPKR
ncbi:MAG TPA: methionine sulfoxide reductase [Myxococcales bacterium]|nr:methionine sulfoxide reductase [Myxococcales bacterium]